jgi:hypothetical protein
MNPTIIKNRLNQYQAYLPLGLIALFYFLCMNFFEAGQQLYYIRRFELSEEAVSYFDLLKGHSVRWLIWLILSIPFVFFIKKDRITAANFNATLIAKYLGVILVNICMTVLIISLLRLWTNGGALMEIGEYFQFFMVQKFAVFLSAYLALIILIHLYFKQAELEGKTYEFLALKEKYQHITEVLKAKQQANSEDRIAIKIGDKVKLIALKDISWIQAADYCVQIHTKEGRSYFLRQTMKAMEQRLQSKGFIRVHRNSIVNRTEVITFRFKPSAEVVLKCGLVLPIANSRVAKVRVMAK